MCHWEVMLRRGLLRKAERDPVILGFLAYFVISAISIAISDLTRWLNQRGLSDLRLWSSKTESQNKAPLLLSSFS